VFFLFIKKKCNIFLYKNNTKLYFEIFIFEAFVPSFQLGINAIFSLWKYFQDLRGNLLYFNSWSFFYINSLLDQFHGRPFYFSPINFSSLEIHNLFFFLLLFSPFLFYFIFHFLSHGPPILLAWPIFPPRLAHHVAWISPSSSLGANRSQDEVLSQKSKLTQNRNQILKDLLLNFKDLFILQFNLNLQIHLFLVLNFYF
jgi:hypothetical protein